MLAGRRLRSPGSAGGPCPRSGGRALAVGPCSGRWPVLWPLARALGPRGRALALTPEVSLAGYPCPDPWAVSSIRGPCPGRGVSGGPCPGGGVCPACGRLPRPVGVCLGLWASALTRGCLHRNPRPDLVTRATGAPGRAGPIEGRPDSVPDRGWGPAFGSSLWVAAVRRGLPVGGRTTASSRAGPEVVRRCTEVAGRRVPCHRPGRAPDSRRSGALLPAGNRRPEPRRTRTASGHVCRPGSVLPNDADAPLPDTPIGRQPPPERCQIAHHSGHWRLWAEHVWRPGRNGARLRTTRGTPAGQGAPPRKGDTFTPRER
jgi:hypothetical protein